MKKELATFQKSIIKSRLINTFLIIGLFVGTIVTLSLYILSNSVLSVAAVPVIPQSFGNCKQWKEEASRRVRKILLSIRKNKLTWNLPGGRNFDNLLKLVLQFHFELVNLLLLRLLDEVHHSIFSPGQFNKPL